MILVARPSKSTHMVNGPVNLAAFGFFQTHVRNRGCRRGANRACIRNRSGSSEQTLQPNDWARQSFAYASMCLSRMTSDSFILNRSCRNHLIAEVSAEVPGSPQVDLAAQLFRQFQFHAGDVEKSDLAPRSNSTKPDSGFTQLLPRDRSIICQAFHEPFR